MCPKCIVMIKLDQGTYRMDVVHFLLLMDKVCSQLPKIPWKFKLRMSDSMV